MKAEQNIQTIENFFKYVKMNDYYSIIKLFSRNAIIYEPFSKENGISGKENLISFFKIMCRASGGLNQDLLGYQNISRDNIDDVISVISTYTKGDSINTRFTFYFQLNKSKNNNKNNDNNKENLNNSLISKLNIEFL